MRSSIDVEREVNTTARFGDVEAEADCNYVGQCHVVLGVARGFCKVPEATRA